MRVPSHARALSPTAWQQARTQTSTLQASHAGGHLPCCGGDPTLRVVPAGSVDPGCAPCGEMMDELHFDALTRGLASSETRRRLLAGLAALPVIGGILGAEETEAAGRRQRRKKRHKHGRGRRRTNQRGKRGSPTCTPDSLAQTCTGRCGPSTDNCGQSVDCGSCACDPPCAACQTCDDQTGQCVADPAQKEAPCGQKGQFCQADGTCACDAASCPVCRSCQPNGECSDICAGSGCCDGQTCQPGTANGACGSGGVTCGVCTGQDACLQDGSNANVCTCVPACDGKACGDDGCGGVCGTCSGALTTCTANQCVCPPGSQACGGFCVPDSCGEGGSLDGCNCLCPPAFRCVLGAVCGTAPNYCVEVPGWQYCEAQGTNRRWVPPCPAGQTLSQETCLCS